MSKTFTVFTYGSLMKGFNGNKKYMQNTIFLGNASINGTLHRSQSEYPVAISNDAFPNGISGELYQVDEKTMKRLRQYEGIGSILSCYTERVVKVKTKADTTIARAFVVSPNLNIPIKLTSRKIASGDWRQFTSPPSKKCLRPKKPLWVIATAGIIMGIIWQVGIS